MQHGHATLHRELRVRDEGGVERLSLDAREEDETEIYAALGVSPAGLPLTYLPAADGEEKFLRDLKSGGRARGTKKAKGGLTKRERQAASELEREGWIGAGAVDPSPQRTTVAVAACHRCPATRLGERQRRQLRRWLNRRRSAAVSLSM